MKKIDCLNCGKETEKNRSNKKFCCPQCGKNYWRTNNNYNQRIDVKKRANLRFKKRMMDINKRKKENIKRKTRHKIKIDGCACVVCKINKATERHHIKYNLTDVIPVCNPCHKKLHKGLWSQKNSKSTTI